VGQYSRIGGLGVPVLAFLAVLLGLAGLALRGGDRMVVAGVRALRGVRGKRVRR